MMLFIGEISSSQRVALCVHVALWIVNPDSRCLREALETFTIQIHWEFEQSQMGDPIHCAVAFFPKLLCSTFWQHKWSTWHVYCWLYFEKVHRQNRQFSRLTEYWKEECGDSDAFVQCLFSSAKGRYRGPLTQCVGPLMTSLLVGGALSQGFHTLDYQYTKVTHGMLVC